MVMVRILLQSYDEYLLLVVVHGGQHKCQTVHFTRKSACVFKNLDVHGMMHKTIIHHKHHT